ncbi:MAG: hypothetical protein AB1942_09430 [Pseudomonadota bacterium]
MTRDGMTPERFATLAEAYGGDVARWPQGEREAAAALMSAEPAWAQSVLSAAAELDLALDAFAAPRAAGDLAQRIAAGAPKPRARWRLWLAPAGMGAGLAAACAAGLVLGVQLGAPQAGVIQTGDGVVTAADDEFSLYVDEAAG